MTESQIWFLLVFSVPFVPAVIVFLLVKPQSGDAKVVGGGIPIFKDLRLELGGAIATYVVIVIFAIVAFLVLMTYQTVAISIRLVPQSLTGTPVDAKLTNWKEIEAPKIAIGRRKEIVEGFVFDDQSHQFKTAEKILVARSDLSFPADVFINENTSVRRGTHVIPISRDMAVPITLSDKMFLEWRSDFDWLDSAYDYKAKTVSHYKVSILTAQSAGLSRIDLGGWSVKGAKRLKLRVLRLKQHNVQKFLEEFDSKRASFIRDASGSAALKERLEKMFEDSVVAGDTEWKWDGKVQFPAAVKTDKAATILFAPLPRVRLTPPSDGKEESIAVIQDGSGEFPEELATQPKDMEFVYTYATKRSAVTVSLADGLSFCGPGGQTTLDGPSGVVLIEDVFRTAAQKGLFVENIQKTARMNVPLEWRLGNCA